MKPYAQVFKNRTVPLLTLVSLLAVLVGYYLFYVRSREDYFTHRYARLLASESSRLRERLSTLDTVFKNYSKDKSLSATDLMSLSGEIELQDSPPADFNIAQEGITREGRVEGERFWIYTGWMQKGKAVAYRFDAFAMGKSLPSEFDVLFVARQDGTVLAQKRIPNQQLRMVNVKKLIGKDGKGLDFATYSQSTSSLDVQLAGDPYKLFLRPCCPGNWGASGSSAKSRPEPEWLVVGGAVPSSTLSVRSWSISLSMAIALIALLVLALLCVPFLRILGIGAEEKLRVADALWIGFTAIVGVGLLTLLLLDLHAYQGLTARIDGSLEDLADKIDENMAAELVAAWRQLDDLNQAALEQIGPALAKAESCKAVHLPDKDRRRNTFIWKLQPGVAAGYTDFERFTWTDSQGQQCFKWSLGEAKDPLVGGVKKRRYFRDALNGGAGIEPVFSWATASRIVALSRRVDVEVKEKKKSFVSVIGAEMSSLNSPVLPEGYGFAVIDQDGKALFHSEPGRAGYENFFAEVDHDSELRALVYARRSRGLNAVYTGRGHRLWIQPIVPQGPSGQTLKPPLWTLVVFSDLGAQRAFNVDTVTTAMLFLVLYLLVYMVVCGLLHATKPRYRAGWLWPERKGEERERIHLRLTVFYLLCLAASIAAIRLLDGVDLLWFAFVFPWAVLLVSYRLCARGITAGRNLLLGAGLASALLLLYHVPSVPFDLESLRGGLLALVSLGLWGFFFLPSTPSRFEPRPPRGVYMAAASLLLALTAAVPAAAFFCVAHRAHLEAAIKRGQLELARGYEERDERVRKSYAQFQGKGQSGEDPALKGMIDRRLESPWDLYPSFFFKSIFDDPADAELAARGHHHPQVAEAALQALPSPGENESDEETARDHCMLPAVFEDLLPLYNEDFVKVRRLMADEGTENAWRWGHPDLSNSKIMLWKGKFLAHSVSSTIPPVSLSGAPLLWPVSLLLLGGTLIGVACFVARRFFLLGVPTPEVVDPTNMFSTQRFFLVSAHIDELAQRLAERGAALIDLRTLVHREDLLECLERQDLASSSRICLHHFEHHLQDQEHNLLKLELMEELILGRDKPVIVLSHVVPAWYLLDRKPTLTAEEKALDPEKDAKRLEAAEKERKEVQERWRGLLRRFLFWVCRNRADAGLLEDSLSSIRKELALPEGSRASWRLERLLGVAREECGVSEQLQKLAGDLVRAHLQDLSPALFIQDLREKAEPYYRTLWAMCTEAEKVILVQLAEGCLVNAKNASALQMLMKRGLVKRDPSFRLMNESFRRFIAADFCLHEVRALEQQAEASTWERMRVPLAVVLLGVAAFIFITQRQIFDGSTTFFTAVATSLPFLFRLLGAITPGQGKSA
jgi:hypothetical protein